MLRLRGLAFFHTTPTLPANCLVSEEKATAQTISLCTSSLFTSLDARMLELDRFVLRRRRYPRVVKREDDRRDPVALPFDLLHLLFRRRVPEPDRVALQSQH